MRSTWEITVAGYLDALHVQWQYEPERFKLKNDRTFCPDFFVPEWNYFLEVKGWPKEKDIRKLAEFRELYPNKPIFLIEIKNYKEIKALGPFDTTALAKRVEKKKYNKSALSEEARARLSAARKGVKRTPEALAAIRAACKTPEHRKAISDAKRRAWEDPQYRARMSSRMLGNNLNEHSRIKQILNFKGKRLVPLLSK
jgi:tRNA nucleotidyltransferase/poly(A) polymerase